MKALILAVAFILAAPAAAQATTRESTVRYGDLDLERTADAQVLLRRLDRAALSVCGASIVSVREQQRAVRASACFRETLGRAVASLDAPTVSALHDARPARPAER